MAPIKASTLRSTLRLGSQLINPTSLFMTRNAVSFNLSRLQPQPQPQPHSALFPYDPKSARKQFLLPTPPKPTCEPSPESQFNTLIHALTTSLTTSTRPNLPHLTRLLRIYNASANITADAGWKRYANANPRKQYTRNLVSEVPGLFQLLMLVWTPGMRSPVHDHAGADCLMKIMKGTLRERRWAMPAGRVMVGSDGEIEVEGMVQTSDVQYKEGKVAYMSDALGVHEVGNPSDSEYAVSLHCDEEIKKLMRQVYTPPTAATRGCNIYDVDNGTARHVLQGCYDSVGGVVIPSNP